MPTRREADVSARRKVRVRGALRYKREGRYVYALPGERSYSTVLMLAEYYFDGRKWRGYVPGLDNLISTTTQED